MSQNTVSDVKTYVASAVIAIYRRVKKDANNKLVVAVATDKELGVTERPALEVDVDTPVRLRTSPGTVIMTAAGVIADRAEVFAAADGKVAATGTVSIGQAESAAGADGDFLEVMRW